MAQRVTVQTYDDIDGTEATRKTAFALDGVAYEIDLSEHNYERLATALQPYIDKARRTGGRKKSTRPESNNHSNPNRSTRSPDYTKKVRDWALANGKTRSDRGRLSHAVCDEYDEAMRTQAVS